MPQVNTQFQGQTLSRPGAYYADDVSGTAASNAGLVPPLVVVGYGFGGKPKTAINFSDTQDLLTALRGGPLAQFVPFIATPAPSGGLNGANNITYINAGANTQATSSLVSAASAVTALLTLLTADYGTPSNLMQVGVAAASNGLGNARQVTLFDGYANVLRQGDDLGVPFTLEYLGSAVTVTYTITKVSGLATVMTVTSPNAGESVTIPLGAGQYDTVESVVEYLNGTAFYSATVQNDGTLPSQYLDAATAVPLAAAAASAALVTAYVPDVYHWFVQYANDLVTAAIPAGVTTSATTIIALQALTHFTGGTCVPPTLADYAAAFNAALTKPGFAVVADSNSSGVVALGTQHAIQASSIPNRRPRRFFSGSSIGDTVAAAIAVAQAQGSTTTCYLYPGIYATSTTTGRNTLYGGLYAAFAAASMVVGNPVATALTNKLLLATGAEVDLTPSQINDLQEGGVIPVAESDDATAVVIVSDETTWQADANPENVFTQQVGCRQWLNYILTASVAPYVGQIAYQGGVGIVRNKVIKTLNAAVYAPGNNGILAAWDTSSLKLSYTGQNQTLMVQVSVQLVGQFRFITIYVPIQALNLTA